MHTDGPLSQLLLWYARTPEHPAKLRMLQWLGRHIFPREGIVGEVMPGVRLLLHPRDWIEYLLLRGSSYEPVTLEFMERNLKQGEGVLLAGVNIGLHLIVAAKAVGAAGIAVGVEPQPASLIRAAANVRLNGVEGTVRILAAALGKDFGFVPAEWPPSDNSGAATLVNTGTGSFWVPTIDPNSLWFLFGQRRCKLTLLDVQGYELRVLVGLLRGQRPDILLCELDAGLLSSAGTSASEVVGLLSTSGYELFDLLGRRLTSEACSICEDNLVAVLPGCEVTWPCASACA